MGGVDLFDLVMASARNPWATFWHKYLATLVYCFVHTTMHLLRVLLLNMAINTSSSAVLLIIVTNNFGEIKSTVFKVYKVENLFPIITSDIVERFYLVVDILFVLARLSVSPHRGTYSGIDVAFWVFLLISLELVTDWVKFCLIMKFSKLEASTLETYKEVLVADILLCRSSQLERRAGPPAKPRRHQHPSCPRCPSVASTPSARRQPGDWASAGYRSQPGGAAPRHSLAVALQRCDPASKGHRTALHRCHVRVGIPGKSLPGGRALGFCCSPPAPNLERLEALLTDAG